LRVLDSQFVTSYPRHLAHADLVRMEVARHPDLTQPITVLIENGPDRWCLAALIERPTEEITVR
jgi:hypothetical protein